MENYKLVFIIAHRYYDGYDSYILHYIDNINKHYENSLILVVDNNSVNQEIFKQINKKNNVVLIENNTDNKFELGAYHVGINYLIDMEILDEYDYVIFTQDTYILKNKYDFNILLNNNVKATPLVNKCGGQDPYYPERDEVLKSIGLFDNLDKCEFCFCNSFVLRNDKIKNFYDYTKHIKITKRSGSEASERYFARILWELNDRIVFALDSCDPKYYGCYEVNPFNDIKGVFFVKKCQQKNENTKG